MYTSTVNVTFGGKPIEQGDEGSVPYFPLDKVPISGRGEMGQGGRLGSDCPKGKYGWSQVRLITQGGSQ